MEVSVDHDRGHVRVLDVEGRPLRYVRLQSGDFAGIKTLRLVLALFQNCTLVLAHTGKIKK